MNKRVVVTGVGILAPNGSTKEEFCAALKVGKSGIKHWEHLKEGGFSCQIGGIPELSQERIKEYLTDEDLLAMNQTMVYTAVASIDAWRDAGFTYDKNDRSSYDPDTGAIIGTGFGGGESAIDKVAPRLLDKKIARMGSTAVEQSMSSGPVAKLAGLLGLGGKVSTLSSACTTGTEAIIDAFNYIQMGKYDRMLAGGAECAHPGVWGGFDAMRVTNRKMNDNPEKASRSLSASASGFVPGSGAGVLILESLDSALARGAKIYCEILAGELNCGGHRNGGSMTAPSPSGVQACIKRTVKSAGIKPEDITAINGHLTATMADPHEVRNWAAALGLPPEKMPLIQATKSMIGHGLGAAGGLECVAVALQLKYQFLHKTINCEDLHPEIEPWRASVNYETKEMSVNIIAKSSFGFGDVNGCLIFKKY
jgi:3-oxoacyl-(acyl-carrier-protein) synthase